MKSLLLAGTCAMVFAIASPAFAQDQSAAASTQDASSSDEITVTANKRAENLQDTPAAITAISSDTLVAAGVSDIRAAQAFVPSARFQQESTSTQVYIRGVGSTLDFPQLEPPTAINFNGIYIPREATSVGLYDIAQVEVLPGPQGTLYGRSSLGGIVNVNFARPSLTNESKGLLEVGNYSLIHASGAQNVVLSDTLALRVAGDYQYHKGYMESGADSANNYGVRLSMLWRPSADFSAYVWGSVADVNGAPPNLVVKGVDRATGGVREHAFLQDNPWNDHLPAPYASILPFGQPNKGRYEYQNVMIGGEFAYDLSENVSLTYIPSYLDFSVAGAYWLAAFPAHKRDAYEQTTHELRLSGDAGWGNWLVGLYGFHLSSNGVFTFGGIDPATRTPGDFFDLGGDVTSPTNGFPVSVVDRNRLKGMAIFGQTVLNVNDAARITLGGRYGVDDRVGVGRYFNGAGLAPYTYEDTFRRFDYKVGIDYDIAPDVMIYAASQSGFQPGTFNPFASTASVSNKVGAAKLTGYTAGIKSRFLDRKVKLNAEFFFYDYRDLFASAYNTVLNLTQTFNASKVEIYGVQVDGVVDFSMEDRLSVSVGYLNARNKKFDLPDGTANYDGLQLQYAPDWTISANYHHDFQMKDGYLRASVGTRYESSFFADFSHTPGGKQKAYTKSDASITYYASNGKWSIGAWIKNIENEAVMAATAAGANIPANPLGATAYLEPPRTFGLRATVNF